MSKTNFGNVISAFVFGAAVGAGVYYACKTLCSDEKRTKIKHCLQNKIAGKLRCNCCDDYYDDDEEEYEDIFGDDENSDEQSKNQEANQTIADDSDDELKF